MKPDFTKYSDRLIPTIIQDVETKNVLMLGYMNEEALEITKLSQKVTFYSRSKKRLWTKGEDSGHFLELVSIQIDCDSDTFLIKVKPVGPTCHTGSDTCWQEANNQEYGFISKLEKTIQNRKENVANQESYVSSLFSKGINKIAQKVGEEAVEMVIEAKDNNTDLFLNESADLLFHYLILLQAKGFQLDDVVKLLKSREK
ncbi:bifunctional phosphoribosyl-AMP cyclohydrolase/phosphoribosyl-ATP diphosphatase HisIE [Flavobacterium luminosum]|uniref:Histidine biosynthesis bifunctional protein HisIE n=1 Tax=Flavobacterium luminosum TaxID=2949086 RepID=A0ABT0TQ47_9FLAO|nr:bifunctional phosphoribosyl-AMP cyclohydrolase/phosphoribosyl-ATP diphosphatase HisIE [Flavobacterium sp. HXWNR70]MCL9809515.1 bifunctional phosphoribosyl-AMP cyclohydrolase/phosphoribosyl-ATP diphosphatase HisIE [Flavobacterium sp. HXWNR70]